MKQTFIILLGALALSSALHAQGNNISTTLQTIEKNNTTLRALRKSTEAQSMENSVGLTLSDPEVEYGHAWGSPGEVSNKQTVKATQTFDLATVSGMKKKVAKEKKKLLEWQYRMDRMDIMLEAKLYCLDMVYYNALLDELSTRLSHAEAIVEGQKERLESGDGNILEYNNVMLSLSALRSEMTLIQTERDAVLAQLTRLNGGEAVSLTQTAYDDISLPANFQEWYAVTEERNPALAHSSQEIAVSRRELKLSKSMNLPSISLGYEGEFEGSGDRHHGVSVGMSIPLWANKNRVKQAKAAIQAAESKHDDTRWQWRSNLEILFQRTKGLGEAAQTYRSSLAESNNSSLLKTALDEGEISVLDYLVGIGLYYDAVNKALDAERAYQKAYAELSAIEL